MIRKALTGASFALGNLSASNRRLINVKSRLISNLTVGEKDEGFPPPTVALKEATHQKFLREIENIINTPEIDLQSCIRFLGKSTDFYKSNSKYLKDLHNESSFKLLCDNLCDRRLRIPSHEASYVLVGLCKLEINKLNPLIVMRYWHRHIDPKIKCLSYVQIEMMLVHVLEHLSNTSWTESKKFLLVRRLRTKILTEELEKLSMTSIISALNLMNTFGIVDIRVSEIFLRSLVNKSPPNWLHIFRILGTLDYLLPEYEHILEQARKHIFENIMDLPLSILIAILRCIRSKVWQGHLKFYDAKFVDAIIDRALWDDCGLEAGRVILSAVSAMTHRHIPLLEYLIKKYEDSENHKNVTQLILLFSYAVKINSEATARFLLEKLMREEKIIKTSREMLVHVTYYMSVLDCYDLGLLQTLFANVDSTTINQLYKLKRLISMVKIFYPSCPVPKIPRKVLQEEKKGNIEGRELDFISDTGSGDFEEEKVKVFPLKSKLELIFGGPEYLLTNVKVKFLLSVDHAVIFRRGGFPVAVNLNKKLNDNNNIQLDELPMPPNSHVVLITSIPWYGYLLNTGEMNGFFSSYIKCLKTLKYDTILVNQVEWKKLDDVDKIPWLMGIIRENCIHVFEDVV